LTDDDIKHDSNIDEAAGAGVAAAGGGVKISNSLIRLRIPTQVGAVLFTEAQDDDKAKFFLARRKYQFQVPLPNVHAFRFEKL
jgi:hypothetical protein